MTNKTALRQLIDAVEVGEPFRFDGMEGALTADQFEEMSSAFNGSLDAAKALHEALLPGWDYVVSRSNSGLTTYAQIEQDITFADCPARAWLIAILKAYEAQQ